MGEKFGVYVRQKREAQGLGLRETAALIGIVPSYLCHLEKGRKLNPSEDVILRLANVLQEDSAKLLRLAECLPSDVMRILLNDPSMVELLREARRRGLKGSDLQDLLRKA